VTAPALETAQVRSPRSRSRQLSTQTTDNAMPARMENASHTPFDCAASRTDSPRPTAARNMTVLGRVLILEVCTARRTPRQAGVSNDR
jgi:hypothetical protein